MKKTSWKNDGKVDVLTKLRNPSLRNRPQHILHVPQAQRAPKLRVSSVHNGICRGRCFACYIFLSGRQSAVYNKPGLSTVEWNIKFQHPVEITCAAALQTTQDLSSSWQSWRLEIALCAAHYRTFVSKIGCENREESEFRHIDFYASSSRSWKVRRIDDQEENANSRFCWRPRVCVRGWKGFLSAHEKWNDQHEEENFASSKTHPPAIWRKCCQADFGFNEREIRLEYPAIQFWQSNFRVVSYFCSEHFGKSSFSFEYYTYVSNNWLMWFLLCQLDKDTIFHIKLLCVSSVV